MTIGMLISNIFSFSSGLCVKIFARKVEVKKAPVQESKSSGNKKTEDEPLGLFFFQEDENGDHLEKEKEEKKEEAKVETQENEDFPFGGLFDDDNPNVNNSEKENEKEKKKENAQNKIVDPVAEPHKIIASNYFKASYNNYFAFWKNFHPHQYMGLYSNQQLLYFNSIYNKYLSFLQSYLVNMNEKNDLSQFQIPVELAAEETAIQFQSLVFTNTSIIQSLKEYVVLDRIVQCIKEKVRDSYQINEHEIRSQLKIITFLFRGLSELDMTSMKTELESLKIIETITNLIDSKSVLFSELLIYLKLKDLMPETQNLLQKEVLDLIKIIISVQQKFLDIKLNLSNKSITKIYEMIIVLIMSNLDIRKELIDEKILENLIKIPRNESSDWNEMLRIGMISGLMVIDGQDAEIIFKTALYDDKSENLISKSNLSVCPRLGLWARYSRKVFDVIKFKINQNKTEYKIDDLVILQKKKEILQNENLVSCMTKISPLSKSYIRLLIDSFIELFLNKESYQNYKSWVLAEIQGEKEKKDKNEKEQMLLLSSDDIPANIMADKLTKNDLLELSPNEKDKNDFNFYSFKDYSGIGVSIINLIHNKPMIAFAILFEDINVESDLKDRINEPFFYLIKEKKKIQLFEFLVKCVGLVDTDMLELLFSVITKPVYVDIMFNMENKSISAIDLLIDHAVNLIRESITAIFKDEKFLNSFMGQYGLRSYLMQVNSILFFVNKEKSISKSTELFINAKIMSLIQIYLENLPLLCKFLDQNEFNFCIIQMIIDIHDKSQVKLKSFVKNTTTMPYGEFMSYSSLKAIIEKLPSKKIDENEHNQYFRDYLNSEHSKNLSQYSMEDFYPWSNETNKHHFTKELLYDLYKDKSKLLITQNKFPLDQRLGIWDDSTYQTENELMQNDMKKILDYFNKSSHLKDEISSEKITKEYYIIDCKSRSELFPEIENKFSFEIDSNNGEFFKIDDLSKVKNTEVDAYIASLGIKSTNSEQQDTKKLKTEDFEQMEYGQMFDEDFFQNVATASVETKEPIFVPQDDTFKSHEIEKEASSEKIIEASSKEGVVNNESKIQITAIEELKVEEIKIAKDEKGDEIIESNEIQLNLQTSKIIAEKEAVQSNKEEENKSPETLEIKNITEKIEEMKPKSKAEIIKEFEDGILEYFYCADITKFKDFFDRYNKLVHKSGKINEVIIYEHNLESSITKCDVDIWSEIQSRIKNLSQFDKHVILTKIEPRLKKFLKTEHQRFIEKLNSHLSSIILQLHKYVDFIKKNEKTKIQKDKKKKKESEKLKDNSNEIKKEGEEISQEKQEEEFKEIVKEKPDEKPDKRSQPNELETKQDLETKSMSESEDNANEIDSQGDESEEKQSKDDNADDNNSCKSDDEEEKCSDKEEKDNISKNNSKKAESDKADYDEEENSDKEGENDEKINPDYFEGLEGNNNGEDENEYFDEEEEEDYDEEEKNDDEEDHSQRSDNKDLTKLRVLLRQFLELDLSTFKFVDTAKNAGKKKKDSIDDENDDQNDNDEDVDQSQSSDSEKSVKKIDENFELPEKFNHTVDFLIYFSYTRLSDECIINLVLTNCYDIRSLSKNTTLSGFLKNLSNQLRFLQFSLFLAYSPETFLGKTEIAKYMMNSSNTTSGLKLYQRYLGNLLNYYNANNQDECNKIIFYQIEMINDCGLELLKDLECYKSIKNEKWKNYRCVGDILLGVSSLYEIKRHEELFKSSKDIITKVINGYFNQGILHEDTIINPMKFEKFYSAQSLIDVIESLVEIRGNYKELENDETIIKKIFKMSKFFSKAKTEVFKIFIKLISIFNSEVSSKVEVLKSKLYENISERNMITRSLVQRKDIEIINIIFSRFVMHTLKSLRNDKKNLEIIENFCRVIIEDNNFAKFVLNLYEIIEIPEKIPDLSSQLEDCDFSIHIMIVVSHFAVLNQINESKQKAAEKTSIEEQSKQSQNDNLQNNRENDEEIIEMPVLSKVISAIEDIDLAIPAMGRTISSFKKESHIDFMLIFSNFSQKNSSKISKVSKGKLSETQKKYIEEIFWLIFPKFPWIFDFEAKKDLLMYQNKLVFLIC